MSMKKTDSPANPPRSAEGDGKSGEKPLLAQTLKATRDMWVIVEPKARTLNRPLTAYPPDDHENEREDKLVGTYFGGLFFHRKHAAELAKQWRGSRVVRVRLEAFTADLPKPARKRAPRKGSSGSSGKRSAVQ